MAHPHGPNEHRPSSQRALLVSLVLNGVFLFIEAGVGWLVGSLALLSDAAHMVSDVGALALALVAARLAQTPPTSARTFGLVRAEVLGAFVNAVALVVACVFIFNEAAHRLLGSPPPVGGWPILVVGAAGLAINLASAWFLWRSGHDNLNIRGALAHMLADALGSLGAMLAAVGIIWFGWRSADAVVSVFIGLLVLWGTWGILRDSTAVLLDFAPRGLGQDVVRSALEGVEGVAGVHELHVRTVGSGQVTVTAHLVPAETASPYEVLRRAEVALRDELGVQHSTLQVEPGDGEPCGQLCCPFLAKASHEH